MIFFILFDIFLKSKKIMAILKKIFEKKKIFYPFTLKKIVIFLHNFFFLKNIIV